MHFNDIIIHLIDEIHDYLGFLETILVLETPIEGTFRD